MLKCRICCTVLQKCIVHTNFCKHFAVILNENLTHVVFFHAACWPFYSPNKRTLFWRCKKDASERECIWYPYMRGSENPSKKSVKKLVRASLLSALLSDIRTLGFLYALCGRCKKRPLLSENAYDILTHAGPKNLPKQVKNLGTGSRRGVTPARLGAQNQWFLTGFRPEGRLHRTLGLDRPGAHFACC